MSFSSIRRLALVEKHLTGNARPVLPMEGACGIIAVVADETESQPAVSYLLEGLTVLQNRGYDSAGVVTIDRGDQSFHVNKFASVSTTSDALVKLKAAAHEHTGDAPAGMGHTRWATHGAKTDVNAHPHVAGGRIAVVHNGVIENADELRVEMASHGLKCVSETDTEVIAQLIAFYRLKEGLSLLDAVTAAQRRLKGSWGVVALDRTNPRELVAAVHGSPLLIGIAKNKKFIASEASAFSRHTKQYVALQDREVVSVTVESELHPERVETADVQEVLLSPAPFPHWTLREIYEQPASVMRALSFGGRLQGESEVRLGGLDGNEAILQACDHLIIAACGTSWHSGLWGARLMRQLHCFKTVQVYDAAELEFHDIPPSSRTAILVLSQSGETKDVLMALEKAQELDIPMFSVVNSVGSTIARTTSCGVYLNAGREVAVASTKAFTSQATVLTLIALWFAQHKAQKVRSQFTRKALVQSLHNLSVNVQRTLDSCHEPAKAVARHLHEGKHQRVFVLGKGAGQPIALEGALKIKEIAYIQAEGYSGAALKHGPFALIEDGTPIIMLILEDAEKHRMLTAAAEVHARGAYVIAIGNADLSSSSVVDMHIQIPDAGLLTSLLASVPLQLIAYELALAYGYSIDNPRHLAKSVTV